MICSARRPTAAGLLADPLRAQRRIELVKRPPHSGDPYHGIHPEQLQDRLVLPQPRDVREAPPVGQRRQHERMERFEDRCLVRTGSLDRARLFLTFGNTLKLGERRPQDQPQYGVSGSSVTD
jgi:hypothetical protein